MEPQSSPWEPAKRDVLTQAMRSVSTRPPTPNIRDESSLSDGAFHKAHGQLGLSTPQVDVCGSVSLQKHPTVWTREDNG